MIGKDQDLSSARDCLRALWQAAVEEGIGIAMDDEDLSPALIQGTAAHHSGLSDHWIRRFFRLQEAKDGLQGCGENFGKKDSTDEGDKWERDPWQWHCGG